MFNEKNFSAQIKMGLIRHMPMKESHPSPQPASEPFCTRSQMISYMDAQGTEVARVHQYLRPDGTIGGSGKPDPKRISHEGDIYLPE